MLQNKVTSIFSSFTKLQNVSKKENNPILEIFFRNQNNSNLAK